MISVIWIFCWCDCMKLTLPKYPNCVICPWCLLFYCRSLIFAFVCRMPKKDYGLWRFVFRSVYSACPLFASDDLLHSHLCLFWMISGEDQWSAGAEREPHSPAEKTAGGIQCWGGFCSCAVLLWRFFEIEFSAFKFKGIILSQENKLLHIVILFCLGSRFLLQSLRKLILLSSSSMQATWMNYFIVPDLNI